VHGREDGEEAGGVQFARMGYEGVGARTVTSASPRSGRGRIQLGSVLDSETELTALRYSSVMTVSSFS
jgi:hypothetical protein